MDPDAGFSRACAMLVFATFLSLLTGATALAADRPTGCGTIRIASMNWASAETMAAIDQFILDHGFGCRALLVPGETMPIFASMTERSEPDVAPEVFVNQFRDELNEAVAGRRIEYAAKVLSDGSEEGFWIPQYVVDAHPEIIKLSDALKRPDLFASRENPARGAVHNCPSGWGCQIMVDNLFRAYDAASKGFDLVDAGSSAGLDASIADAFAEKRGWLGYYWSPTPIIGRYPMTKLKFDVPFNNAEWKRCTTQPDCPDPKLNAWTPADVYTLVTPRLEVSSPAAAAYLARRAWNNETVNRVLAWKDENRASGEAAAHHFLETRRDVWQAWVSPEVAKRVEAAL